jgi:hypothetical protein
VHDFSPGILPNGLFWTMQIPRGDIDWLGDGKIARLSLRNLPLVDTFQFAGPLAVAAAVDIDLRWRATGPFEQRGEGSTVDETSPGAFLGRFAPARCTGSVRGWETGFAFRTGRLTSDTFYAQLGRERNGVFLD